MRVGHGLMALPHYPCKRRGHARHNPGTGLTPRETTIMDLWDQGRSAQAIERQLGLPKDTAANIISIYDGKADLRTHRTAMARASAQLAAAIKAARATARQAA